MIKKLTILTLCLLALTGNKLFAQASATATQTVHIQVAPAIEIVTNTVIEWWKKKNNGNGFGLGKGNGNQKVASQGDNGYGQEITVRSNKEFMVSIKSTDNTQSNVLLALKDNQTGGTANPAYSDYAPVTPTSQDLLMNCAYGNEKSFLVACKTKSGKAKQPEISKADIIYTATLP
ncbi:MAG: hypothetical protein JNL72_02410 [Flavipsychrobacter sp.]|nr:hypothetical protein [Flavipsychrobacter sp.]